MFYKEKPDYNSNQFEYYSLDQLIPEDHFLCQVEQVINFEFIYELV